MLDYHAALVADELRTRAFLSAFDRLIRPGMRVLDVGTGTGVLAVAAAQRGAEVVAVERSEMIEYARVVAAANDVKIEWHNRDIADIADSAIAPVDVIVSEMLGNFLLDEDLLGVFASARRFLRPGGVIIPRRVRYVAALGWSKMIDEAVRFWKQPRFGIDFAPLAECLENSHFDELDRATALAGIPARIDEIDLAHAMPGRYEFATRLEANAAGDVNAVLVWWEAELAPGVTLDMGPGVDWPKLHWLRTVLPVPPRSVQAGERIPFSLTYDPSPHPPLWSWTFDGAARSTFLSVPPTRERRNRLFGSGA
jgi:SAM-dependent methyltransferase